MDLTVNSHQVFFLPKLAHNQLVNNYTTIPPTNIAVQTLVIILTDPKGKKSKDIMVFPGSVVCQEKEHTWSTKENNLN
jgi:hypothetical protein